MVYCRKWWMHWRITWPLVRPAMWPYSLVTTQVQCWAADVWSNWWGQSLVQSVHHIHSHRPYVFIWWMKYNDNRKTCIVPKSLEVGASQWIKTKGFSNLKISMQCYSCQLKDVSLILQHLGAEISCIWFIVEEQYDSDFLSNKLLLIHLLPCATGHGMPLMWMWMITFACYVLIKS